MTHTQFIYLLIVVAAFLVFTGSLLKVTISSFSASPGDAGASRANMTARSKAASTKPH